MLTPLPPFASLLDRGNSLNSSSNHSKAFLPEQSLNGKGIGELNRKGHQRDNFAIFNEVLQKAYQRIAFSPAQNQTEALSNVPSGTATHDVPRYQQVDKISSEQAAGTILGFITQKLKLDEANGAGQHDLLKRLDEGLEGFVKGFDEAKDIIEGMGLLTPELASEIEDTYDIVTKGIEELRDGINGTSTAAVNQLTLAGQHSDKESFSLELTTQDGDKVSIDIFRSSQVGFSSSFDTGGNSSSLTINQQSSQTSSFSLNVTGELDEDEMAAINQLLQDVDQIADDFFQGNLDDAFNQALELNINREELSSLNLQLQKTTTTHALAAYESTAQANSDTTEHSASPVMQMKSLLDNVQKILDEARVFAQPMKLLEDVTNGLAQLNKDSFNKSDILNNENHQHHQANELNDMIKSLAEHFDL